GELVVLSIVVAILSSFVAMTTISRLHRRHLFRWQSLMWMFAFGISMGAGIWSMHFTAMLAMQMPVDIGYDWPLTLLSLLVAIAFTGLGAAPLRHGGSLEGGRLLAMGCIVGLGIAAMHYTGMAAMRMDAGMVYSPAWVAVSVFVAMAASTAALWVANHLRGAAVFSEMRIKSLSSIIMGLAVTGMHFTAMLGTSFYFSPSRQALSPTADAHWLAMALAIVVALGQGSILIFAALDEAREARRASQEQLRLNQALKDVLGILNSSATLDDRLHRVLQSVLSHSWLGLEPKGSIFTLEDGGLRMRASQGMGELQTRCAHVPAGRCLCGRAAAQGSPIIKPHLDEAHDIRIEGMLDHGHCVLPLKIEGRVFGVLNIYLPAGGALSTGQMSFLEGVAEALAQALAREADMDRVRLLETVIAQLPDAVFVADADGRIIYANEACGHFYHVAHASMMHAYAYKVASGVDDGQLPVILKQLQDGRPWSGEVELDGPDGGRWVRRLVAPINDGQCFVCMDHDITEERQQREHLQHIQRLDSLGILAGGIAHDFNNLLTAILGNAALAERKAREHGLDMDRYFSHIVASSEKAASLCRQMLAYSGKGNFVIQPLNLSDEVEKITELLEVSISKHVAMQFHLEKELPLINADASQMQQVIMNLVINASEAIGDQAGVINISTGRATLDQGYLEQTVCGEGLSPGEYVFLEVSDNGCGMDEQTRKRVFDPFFTTKEHGHGLGMSAILGIVRSHNGTMRVYSEPGRGSSFKLLLPVPEQNLEMESGQRSVEQERVPVDGLVLIADDDESIRETAAVVLGELGFDTLMACDGQECLDLYRQFQDRICGVLLDMTMPRMDGYACYRELRRINPEVRVILSSGYTEHEITARLAGKGFSGFLQKPYRPESLMELAARAFAA
ncbi:MAG: response regulator, partial [Gammaproteobacteria bacterium]